MATTLIYFVIFLVFTAVHLYGSYIKRDSLRAPTKPVILLAVLGIYLEWLHAAGVEPSPFVIAALLTSWLGDMLLIPRGVKWFALGGVSFLISHVFFILAYNESGIDFSAVSPVLTAIIALLYAAVCVVLFRKLKPHLPKALFWPMFFYLMTNGAMNAFAWFRLLSGSCGLASGIITGIGALLFFISDCTLFFVRFDKNCRIKSHFSVMLAYSLGELMIVHGLILLAIH